MRWKRPSPWSLDHPRYMIPLTVGSAVGVGNFFTLPKLFLGSGGMGLLMAHLLGLILLGSTILLAEFVWARWLLRPYQESFSAVLPRWSYFPFLSLLALGLVSPPYFLEMGRLLMCFVGSLNRGGFTDPHLRSHINASTSQSFAGAAIVGVSCFLICLQAPFKMAKAMTFLISYALIALTVVGLRTLASWGWGGMSHLLDWNLRAINPTALFQVTEFSLFSLSVGFGIMFTFTYYASQAPRKMSFDDSSAYWKRPTRLLIIAFWVIAADFWASLLSLIIVSPYALYEKTLNLSDSAAMILDWIPQILVRGPGGPLMIFLLFSGLFAAGLASAVSLWEVMVFTVERSLRTSRNRASLHVLLWGAAGLVLPLIPALERNMTWLGADILLPLSGIGLCVAVGWKMPDKARSTLFGRGPRLDSLFNIWRFSLRYLTPAFLMYYLLRQLI